MFGHQRVFVKTNPDENTKSHKNIIVLKVGGSSITGMKLKNTVCVDFFQSNRPTVHTDSKYEFEKTRQSSKL